MNWATAVLLAGAVLATAAATVDAGEGEYWFHPKCTPLATDHMGPFVLLADGRILSVTRHHAIVSSDEGKTWAKTPLFKDSKQFRVRSERALFRTRDGVILLAFLNQAELTRGKLLIGDPNELAKWQLPAYIVRSLDDGKTWEEPLKLQDGWCGAVRHMIQTRTGRIVLACQLLASDPGRQVTFTYASDDEGKTWRRSNIIDLGGRGGEVGAIEGTLVELRDGRLWMLCRTVWGRFWEAFSADGGLSWRVIRPSNFEASSSPGMLMRLASGRLVLAWNRFAKGREKRVGMREELSIAFSNDDGKTWTEPVVFVGGHGKWKSYPYILERRPGELWLTAMQGKVRHRLFEKDFVNSK